MAKMPSDLNLGERPTARPAGGLAQYRGDTGALEEPGRAMMRAGSQVSSEGDRLYAQAQVEIERADNLRVQDAINQLKDRTLQLQYGETEGFARLKGAEAATKPLLTDYTRKYEDAVGMIAGTLSSDRQKEKFRVHQAPIGLAMKDSILRHQMAQGDAYSDQVFGNAFKTATDTVAANPLNPLIAEAEILRLENLTKDQIERKGFTGKAAIDAFDIAKKDIRDKLLTTRIETLLYDKPLEAEALLKANENNISDPKLRLLLQSKTQEASMLLNTGRDARAIVAEVIRTPGARAQELADKQFAGTATEADLKELGTVYKQLRPQGGALDLSTNTSDRPTAAEVSIQLPAMIAKVEKMANERYGTDVGNPVRAAYIRRLTAEVEQTAAKEVRQLNALEQRDTGLLLDAVTGLGGLPQSQPISNLSQIQQDPALLRAFLNSPPQTKQAIANMIENRQGKGDETLFRSLWERIHLDPSDPRKIDFYKQITTPEIAGKLSIPQINQLRLELDRSETPGGRSITQLRKGADAQVAQWFKTNIMFTAQPERQIAATMRWNEEVGKKIDEYVKAGKDVRSLFTLDSKDSVVSQDYLNTFVNSTPAQGVAQAVKDGQPQMAPVVQPAAIKTREQLDAWFQTLPQTQTTFTGADGVVRKIPGRGPAAPAAPGAFQPESKGYDYATATAAGMGPDGTGENKGHWGSVAPAPEAARAQYGLPKDSYIMLKGRDHETWAKGVEGEEARGAKVVKLGDRYYSVPKDWNPPAAPKVVLTDTGKLVPAPAARAPGELPAFKGPAGMSEQDRANHIGGLFEAVKAVVTAATKLDVAGPMETAGRAMVDSVSSIVGWLQNGPKENRMQGARAGLRYILSKDEFTAQDIPMIEAALKWGDLDPGEKKKAKAMLKAAGVD